MRRQLTIAIKRNETWPESAVIAAVKRRLNKITQVSVRVRLYDGIHFLEDVCIHILAGVSRKQLIDAVHHDVASPTAVEATGHTGNECRSDRLGLLCSMSFRPFNLQLPWHPKHRAYRSGSTRQGSQVRPRGPSPAGVVVQNAGAACVAKRRRGSLGKSFQQGG